MKAKNIGIIIGSLRKASYSRMAAEALVSLSPEGLTLKILEIDNLPMYSEDLDKNPPSSWTHFRNKIKAVDGLLFVTPEYNRSIPGCLKNALDVASRPYGKSVFNSKPSGVISLSVGSLGGFGANHHLRQCLSYLNSPTMPTPEAYIGDVTKLFDKHGRLTEDTTIAFLKRYMSAFEEWVGRNTNEVIDYSDIDIDDNSMSLDFSYINMF